MKKTVNRMSINNNTKKLLSVLLTAGLLTGTACGKQTQDKGEVTPEPEPLKMTIHRTSATSFDVLVPQTDDKDVLVHHFVHQYYSSALNYGNGKQKTILCGDVWYPEYIKKQGELDCIQGNLNFIFYTNPNIAGYENEACHVGAGHGCEIRNSQKFYADGTEFDPDSSFEDIECSELRIVLNSNVYAVDATQPGHKSSRALPKLDAEGNLVLTAVHDYDAVYKTDNTIEWDNSLEIKRDNLQFKQAHGGMLQGKAQFFNMVTIGDENESTNKFTYDASHNVTTTPIGNCPKFDGSRFHKASWLKMFGKGITVTQTMSQAGDRSGENYLMFIFYSGASTNDPTMDRLKVYMQPVKSIDHFGAAGAEFFNKGDKIQVHLKRTIELY